ncbi:TPA: hypothetical protein ACP3ZG_001587 [Pseudomonas aeruginosa]|uniref:Uncharacterized protein n=1 Tax=Pseudomonas aeruginosa TaxID=287 RepID=A0A241XRY8_PSEAI|nr:MULTISPECIES: hypothetical protein [Pseudomonas]ELG7182096.1 hypothetical protein [Pseudomonas aeruginosa]MBH4094953.1 hypothetical protein [Pseudomonas aeruginosa]MBI6603330.1 hypothetical protein [Pseudomonas sp. S4_EA_1b]MBI8852525.1 hypothetical protein [Pseudomonas aeruginosa]OBY57599.1 hypothetical protein A9513_002960 [Pseudomonas sp. AU12215]
MTKLNVYCCTLAGRAEGMVAARSRKVAAELLGLSLYELTTYGHEPTDADEAVALGAPGAVFHRADGFAGTGPWVLSKPAPERALCIDQGRGPGWKALDKGGLMEKPMTLAQRFKQKALELVPQQDELQNLDPGIDDPHVIDETMFRRSEFLGGMAAVILALLARSEQE